MRALHVPLVLVALAGLLSACALEPAPDALQTGTAKPPAADTASRGTAVVPGRPARVFVMAGLAAGCKSTGPPTMVIDRQPTQGALTFQPGQDTTIQYSLSGNCVGQRVQGTGIYYTARPGAIGGDVFTVTARMGSGEVATRTFNVQIAE